MRLIDVPNGSIFRLHDDLVLKTEYFSRVDDVYIPDCYIIGTGEKFWGGMKTKDDFKTKFNDLEVEVINVLPDVSDTSSDTISRQQAIEKFAMTAPQMSVIRIYEAVEILESMPTIQPEPKEGHWIPHESHDGGEQYECSECGVLWEFNDGTPEDNEAYFCPKCGARMKGEI